MFFLYMLATLLWIRLMRQYKDNTISLHCQFAVLIMITCLECAIIFVEYDVYNEVGRRRMPLTFLSVIFFALRETLGHIICLLISLGYGIVMNVLN